MVQNCFLNKINSSSNPNKKMVEIKTLEIEKKALNWLEKMISVNKPTDEDASRIS